MIRPTTVSIALGALAAGCAAAGAAAGISLERALLGRVLGDDPDRDEPYGALRGRRMTVLADDGTALIAEVDDTEDPYFDDLTVIFSHGYALNMDCWHYQRRDLRGSARLVFWDQRSHGRSGRGPVGSHTIAQLGADLARIIAECAPSGPIVLVGHSMGGMTIMSLADQHPELFGDRVRGVALIATSSGKMNEVNFGLPRSAAGYVHSRAEEFATIAKARSEVIERNRAKKNDLTYLLTSIYSFGARTSPTHARFVADMLAATPIDVLADFMPHLSAHDKREALAVLQQVESLVMVGERDMMTPQQHSTEIVRHLPGAELVMLPSTGHMIISERYEEVNQHLAQLLRMVRRNLPR
jgi:pimeloyl-ACP methyl ester carboxylesterase